jgi:hypothetical protein
MIIIPERFFQKARKEQHRASADQSVLRWALRFAAILLIGPVGTMIEISVELGDIGRNT